MIFNLGFDVLFLDCGFSNSGELVFVFGQIEIQEVVKACNVEYVLSVKDFADLFLVVLLNLR